MRTLPNGFIVLDPGDEDIPPPVGYERATDNPRVFLPELPECDYLKVTRKKACCGNKGMTESYRCDLKEVTASRGGCISCGGQHKPST